MFLLYKSFYRRIMSTAIGKIAYLQWKFKSLLYIYIYIYIYVCVCVLSVFVCIPIDWSIDFNRIPTH